MTIEEKQRALDAAKKTAAGAHVRMLGAIQEKKRDISGVCDKYVTAAKALADAVRAYAGEATS
jgi:hypothetical protein